MSELHRIADKLQGDIKQIEGLDRNSLEADEVALMLAKRVRRNSNLLVRHLAEKRDATAEEAQAQ